MQSFFRVYELPWSWSGEDQQRFRRIQAWVAGIVLALAIVFPFLPVPEPDPNDVEEVPQRFARLILEQKAPPPPPPPPPPEPEIVEPDPEPVVKEVKPEPEKPPEPLPEPEKPDARERASVAGLLPFAEDLADLRENEAVAAVSSDRDLVGDVGAGPRAERSLITSKVGSGSGGINTAALSRNTGGGGLAGRGTTQVASPVAAIGAAGGAKARRSGGGKKASRSREEIEMVFDRNKGAIYALYNRALRKDPTLEGKLVLRLTIAPNGAVTACEVISSELGDADLERKLVARVKLFKFDAKDVEAVTTTKPIDFFPA